MNTIYKRMVALGPSLSHSAVRVLQELTVNPGEPRSGRQLSQLTGLSHSNVRAAIAELERRHIISGDGGTASRGSIYRLTFAETLELPVPIERVPVAGTLPFLESVQGVPAAGTVPVERVPEIGTPAEPESVQGVPAAGTHPRARGYRSDSIENPIDRVLAAKPKDCDPEALAHWRSWLFSHMQKLARQPLSHPPDNLLLAQFMACGTSEQLQGLLYDLLAEKKGPDHSYGWFVTVALQRIHGIDPRSKRPKACPQAVPARTPSTPPVQVSPPEQQLLTSSAEVRPFNREELEEMRQHIFDIGRKKALR